MKRKINTTVLFLLLIIGFFFPTSSNGKISINLSLIQSYILISLLIILLLTNKLNKTTILLSFFINFLLLLFTCLQIYLNNFNLGKLSWGSYLPFLSLTLVYAIPFSRLKWNGFFDMAFILINLFNIVLGFLIILNFPIADNFVINHYSIGYQELIPFMLISNKPVNFFGSHSIASFFYILFFYMSFQKFIYTKKKIYFLLTFCDIVLIYNLKSVSAFGFLAFIILGLFVYLFKKNKVFFIFFTPPIVTGLAIALYAIRDRILTIFGSENNGLLGRYTGDSPLASTFHYITNHILPIGLWTSSDLYFTDSGFVVNYLKGGLILVIVIYLGLFLFFKSNLKNKTVAYTLFGIIILFEIGYPILNFNRMLYFMPFIIIYMKNIEYQSSIKTLQNKNEELISYN